MVLASQFTIFVTIELAYRIQFEDHFLTFLKYVVFAALIILSIAFPIFASEKLGFLKRISSYNLSKGMFVIYSAILFLSYIFFPIYFGFLMATTFPTYFSFMGHWGVAFLGGYGPGYAVVVITYLRVGQCKRSDGPHRS